MGRVEHLTKAGKGQKRDQLGRGSVNLESHPASSRGQLHSRQHVERDRVGRKVFNFAAQTEYSLWTRDPERELLRVMRELGTGLVAWSPLGSGFFAGSADTIGRPGEDFRHNAPRFKPDNLAANRDRYAPLRQIAAELAITPAQLALGWLLHQGEDIVPIPGTRTSEHLDENLAAAEIELRDDVLAQIDEVAPAGAAAGAALL